MKQSIIDQIKKAIRNQKWDKHSYSYAINSMDHFNTAAMFPDTYKKAEIIAEFYRLIETRFYLIQNYTTFKNIEL